MTQERFERENVVFKDNLPIGCYKFVVMDTNNPHLLTAAKTRNGKVYTLRIDLDGFPEECPNMYVTQMLHDNNGNELKDEDSILHVLTSKYGYTHISHFSPTDWAPHVSLYKVYLMGYHWLNMYEHYLKTGEM